ncbi:MAG: hypothetical protein ACOYMN_04070 [Roseimicrobium sp.]
MNLRTAPLILLALLPMLLGFNRKPKFTITFHSQGDETELKKNLFPMQLEGRPMLFNIIPEFSQQNIAAFHPFESDTGNGKGVALQLDFRGREALEMVTRTRHGQFLLAMLDGKPVDYVVLDEVIDSGLVTIWQGVSDDVIKQMDKKYTRIKPGSPPSVTDDMAMSPTTRKEKERALDAARDAARAEEKKQRRGEPEEQPLPSLSAPPTRVPSTKLPVEGTAGSGSRTLQRP